MVCPDGSGHYLTIQEGIDAASDGWVVVVCDGTYTGPNNTNLDFGGKRITVRSANGPNECIIDCDTLPPEYRRGFYFHNGETGYWCIVAVRRNVENIIGGGGSGGGSSGGSSGGGSSGGSSSGSG